MISYISNVILPVGSAKNVDGFGHKYSITVLQESKTGVVLIEPVKINVWITFLSSITTLSKSVVKCECKANVSV